MRVGCFGLSANPPHIGHIEAARLFLRSGYFDEIWLIPVFNHPFADKDTPLQKTDMAPWEHRFAMCKLLEERRIRVSAAESDMGGVSYSVKTLGYLRKKHLRHSFEWCVGSDIVAGASYTSWHNWEKMLVSEKIYVAERPGHRLDPFAIPLCFVIAGETFEMISSTEIRQRIRGGKDVRMYTGEEVARYIKQHKLYEEEASWENG